MEMLTVAVHFVDTSEDEECVQLNRRELRDTHSVLEMPMSQFIANFRISKEMFRVLLEKFENKSTPAFRSTNIRGDIKLATFLRFLATGSYQQTVGNELLSSTCKSSTCGIIAECLMFFEKYICGEWIKMISPEEENCNKQAFFSSTGFPGIIGCVDGTHIRIKSPGNNLKHLYYNRKGYYSINAMVICDHKTHIMYVDARHPGANHDAFVWEQSFMDEKLRNNFENGQRNTWILGDAGYKLKPYLMTPYRNPSSAEERLYNKKHTSARNVVERCFRILKNRFRCIIGSRGLHYEPKKVTQIINACCALHNMCVFYKCEEPTSSFETQTTNDDLAEAEVEEVGAERIRRNIALNL